MRSRWGNGLILQKKGFPDVGRRDFGIPMEKQGKDSLKGRVLQGGFGHRKVIGGAFAQNP
jgi:hypothetical protein